MRVLHILRALPLAAALALTPLIRLRAQASSPTASAPSSAGSASTAKPALKALNLDDYSGWNRIGNTALSRDGKWMTFAYTPNEGGDPVLHVKSLDSDKGVRHRRRGGARWWGWTRGRRARCCRGRRREWRIGVFRGFSLGGVPW
jgi:hypothetical protein